MEQHQDLAQRALQTVLNTGMQAENDRDMRAKRCFDVEYKEGQKSRIRLILAAPAEAVQIQVEVGRATMSKAAKEIRDALKASGNGGGSCSGPKRRRKK